MSAGWTTVAIKVELLDELKRAHQELGTKESRPTRVIEQLVRQHLGLVEEESEEKGSA